MDIRTLLTTMTGGASYAVIFDGKLEFLGKRIHKDIAYGIFDDLSRYFSSLELWERVAPDLKTWKKVKEV